MKWKPLEQGTKNFHSKGGKEKSLFGNGLEKKKGKSLGF